VVEASALNHPQGGALHVVCGEVASINIYTLDVADAIKNPRAEL